MARLAGLEPTTSASAGLRSIQLSYKRNVNPISQVKMVPKGRFELPCPYGHYALNVARLPFRHFGMVGGRGLEPLTSAMIGKRFSITTSLFYSSKSGQVAELSICSA